MAVGLMRYYATCLAEKNIRVNPAHDRYATGITLPVDGGSSVK